MSIISVLLDSSCKHRCQGEGELRAVDYVIHMVHKSNINILLVGTKAIRITTVHDRIAIVIRGFVVMTVVVTVIMTVVMTVVIVVTVCFFQ